jgi:phosphatidylserine decarboxylase
MDPFVVVSFGKKVFRTRVIRHSLNPVWDEKLLFHVRRYEKSFQIQFAIFDWDKLSSNDYVGEASLDLKELLDIVPQPDPITGLYSFRDEDNISEEMKEFKLSLSMQKTSLWDAGNPPIIKFR